MSEEEMKDYMTVEEAFQLNSCVNGEEAFNIACCYGMSRGGYKHHLLLAQDWFKKSAELGYAKGQCKTGNIKQFSRWSEQDVDLAFYWYKQSAEQGYAPAQYYLAKCYEDGIGCEKNASLAFEWATKSAKQDVDGQYLLANYYKFGHGCKQNMVEALRWYKKSFINNEEEPVDYEEILENVNLHRVLTELIETIEKQKETIETFETTNAKLQDELKMKDEIIAELEITCPIEGGSEYQKAKQRFDEYKKG